jgi:hypothetical protein
MIGLGAGLVLAVAVMAWVLAPIARRPVSRKASADARSESEPACPHCGAAAESVARFCSNCGRPMPVH